MVEFSTDGIQQALNKALDMGEPVLFATGFIFGATEAASANGHYSSLNTTDDPNAGLYFRISDAIAFTTGQQVSINGHISGGSFTFKPTGFLNKGLAVAVGAWVYKEAKLPYAKEIYKAAYPFGIGYSVGGFFDPGLTGGASYGPISNVMANPATNPISVSNLNARLN